jgi:hypothetical protein
MLSMARRRFPNNLQLQNSKILRKYSTTSIPSDSFGIVTCMITIQRIEELHRKYEL